MIFSHIYSFMHNDNYLESIMKNNFYIRSLGFLRSPKHPYSPSFPTSISSEFKCFSLTTHTFEAKASESRWSAPVTTSPWPDTTTASASHQTGSNPCWKGSQGAEHPEQMTVGKNGQLEMKGQKAPVWSCVRGMTPW